MSMIKLADADTGEAEVEAIRVALQSGVLTNGPQTEAFEKSFASRHQVQEAVAFANGTVALAGMYLALGIGPGDEVIVPSLTFISSATSVMHVGATPVFAEIDPQTFTLDPQDAARRITERTRAILAVHYGGQPADLADLQVLCSDSGVALLEDAAQAHGVAYRGRPVGGFGTMGMFSFTPTKNITTGEGGMVTTDDAELAGKLRLLRNHGQTSEYRHETLGWNWRMSEIQAAMGVVQMGKLDAILARKRSNAKWMKGRLEGVAGVATPVHRPDREHGYMLYTLLLEDNRDMVLEKLRADGIEAKLYFPPAHSQPVFSRFPTRLPVTEQVSRRLLSVPFHSKLTPQELEEIAHKLEAAVSTSMTVRTLPQ